MTTHLTSEFIESIRDSERTMRFGERDLVIRHSTARSGSYAAELEVLEGASILGYITPYASDEHGAVPAHLFGRTAPELFRDLDSALAEILRHSPDRRGE